MPAIKPPAQPHHTRTVSAWRRALIFGSAWLGVAGAAQAQTPRQGSASGGGAPLPALGQPLALPEEVELLDGSTLRPLRGRDKVLVLYWWASWCPFCAIQSPMMDKLWRARRDDGLQMLGLSIDKKREDAIAYLRAKGYAFASTLVTPQIEQILPRAKGLPVTVVLGRDGKVVMAEAGQLFPEDIDEIARFL
jgi:thiol-disulfide isomerase/thioredoxin